MRRNLFSLDDRVVIVTGGLGQLGRQFTVALLDQGARVAVFDVRTDGGIPDDAFRAGMAADRLALFAVDITRRRAIDAALDELKGRWGTPHGLVNNAALDAPPSAPAEENGPFEHYPETSWDQVMRVNVTGTFLCCQAIGGAMAEAGRGAVVNVSSIYGLVSPDQRLYEYRRSAGNTFFKPVAYSASKSAVVNLTRYLATYWAPRNVRVNTVTFGGVYNRQDDQFVEGYSRRVPLGRMARVDEYNGTIIYLLSDASSYMTGSNVVVDGGWTAW